MQENLLRGRLLSRYALLIFEHPELPRACSRVTASRASLRRTDGGWQVYNVCGRVPFCHVLVWYTVICLIFSPRSRESRYGECTEHDPRRSCRTRASCGLDLDAHTTDTHTHIRHTPLTRTRPLRTRVSPLGPTAHCHWSLALGSGTSAPPDRHRHRAPAQCAPSGSGARRQPPPPELTSHPPLMVDRSVWNIYRALVVPKRNQILYYLRPVKDCQSQFLENGWANTYF